MLQPFITAANPPLEAPVTVVSQRRGESASEPLA